MAWGRFALAGLVGALVGCAPAVPVVHIGVSSAIMGHGGVATIVRTLAARSAVTADLVPLPPEQALVLLARGDVDAVITDSHPDAEAAVARQPRLALVPLWRLDVVLCGPANDPAQVQGQTLPTACRRIAEAQRPFVSLADHSGVNRREQEMWVAIGHPRRAGWYREPGNGGFQALDLAREQGAYVLTDAATAATSRARLGALQVLTTGTAADAVQVDLVLGPGRREIPFWRTLADALPAAVTALPPGYGPLSPSGGSAGSGRSDSTGSASSSPAP